LVRRVAFDCISATKRKILEACIAGEELANVKLPGSTRSYAVEDLTTQDLLDGNRLSNFASDLLTKAGVI